MGWYFYKRIKLAKGLWLNLSKSGVTTSAKIGPTTVNVAKDGLHTSTAVVTGSGLRYRTSHRWKKMTPEQVDQNRANFAFAVLKVAAWLFVTIVVFMVMK